MTNGTWHPWHELRRPGPVTRSEQQMRREQDELIMLAEIDYLKTLGKPLTVCDDCGAVWPDHDLSIEH